MKVRSLDFDMRLIGGIGTWLVVSAIALLVLRSSPELDNRAAAMVALQLVFLLSMLVAARLISALDTAPLRLGGFVLMAVSALALGLVAPVDFLPIYTIIWIAFAPKMLPRRPSYLLLAVAMVAWYVIETVATTASRPSRRTSANRVCR